MTSAAKVHGDENGAKGRDVFMAALGTFIIAGGLFDSKRKECSSHKNYESRNKHSGGKRKVRFGDWDA